MAEAALATTNGRVAALKELAKRRVLAAEKGRIDNAGLSAGWPMYYYCKACGLIAEILPENHIGQPKSLCIECQALKDCGWLE